VRKTKLGRHPIYPWDDLIDGEEHDFKAGEDFQCTPQSFAALVRYTAKVRGLRAVVSVYDNTVYFAFVPLEKTG
jgi:hypothetical protein